MVRRGTVKETEIAAAVVRWLVDMEWTVYQEVSLGGRVIDLVATRGPLVWAIECKVSLGLAVLEQAYGLLGYAHYVSVAVREPTSEDSVVRWFAEQVVAAEHGIGVLEVGETYNEDYTAKELVAETKLAPKLWRRVRPIENAEAAQLFQKLRPMEHRKERREPYLRELLTEAQRDHAPAGNNRGQRWSPFVGTCAAVREYVAEHPGCLAAECMRGVQHHYRNESTARNSMVQWVDLGKVPGVAQRRDGHAIRWWPREDTTNLQS